jgi:Flp pilus assembly protein TadD
VLEGFDQWIVSSREHLDTCVAQGRENAVEALPRLGVEQAGRYGEALAVLDLLKNPNTPVALNYRGYATRKLGRIDEGISYYLKSVALDPHYAQVREYLGEAYLLKGDAAQAKAQLQAIKQICGTVCEAYEHLAVAIADPADL